eukprot:GGOE01001797.1.p1 GENE.GGOE01001797.1~~GGOE01001797.1.p1  ORF type:complete len:756 (-),score=133.68 GGOE01001797.1:283-2433(-)
MAEGRRMLTRCRSRPNLLQALWVLECSPANRSCCSSKAACRSHRSGKPKGQPRSSAKSSHTHHPGVDGAAVLLGDEAHLSQVRPRPQEPSSARERWPEPTVPRNVVERYLATRAQTDLQQRLPPFVEMDRKVQEQLRCLSSIGAALENFDLQVPLDQPPITIFNNETDDQSSCSGISEVEDPRTVTSLAGLLQLTDPDACTGPWQEASLTEEDIRQHHSLLVDKRRRAERRALHKQQQGKPCTTALMSSQASSPALQQRPPTPTRGSRLPLSPADALQAPIALQFSEVVVPEAYQRRRRWGPVLSALEHVEESVIALEALYAPGQEPAHQVIRDAHAAEGRELLGEGLVGEAEELSSFLRKRLEDIHDRAQLLLVYDRIRNRQQAQSSEHRATQVWPDLLAPRRTLCIATEADSPTTDLSTNGREAMAGSRPSWLGSAGSPFSHVITRMGCAIRVQAVVRGHLARMVYGNVTKGLLTFFNAAEPRWRAIWEAHARGEVRAQEWLLEWARDVLDAKATHDYLQDLHGIPQMPFNRFLQHHLTRCFEGAFDVRTGLLLRTLQHHKACHPVLAALYNIMMGTWGEEAADALLKTVCVLAAHAVGGSLGRAAGTSGFDVVRPRLVTPKTVAVLTMAVWPERNCGDAANDLIRRLETLTRHRGEMLDFRTRSLAAQLKKPAWGATAQHPDAKHPTENDLLFCISEMAAEEKSLPANPGLAR